MKKEHSDFIIALTLIIFCSLLVFVTVDSNRGLINSLLIYILGIICMFGAVSNFCIAELSEKDSEECNKVLFYIGGFAIIISLILIILVLIYS